MSYRQDRKGRIWIHCHNCAREIEIDPAKDSVVCHFCQIMSVYDPKKIIVKKPAPIKWTPWLDEKIQFLEDHYHKYGVRYCFIKLGSRHSLPAIRIRAQSLGLKIIPMADLRPEHGADLKDNPGPEPAGGGGSDSFSSGVKLLARLVAEFEQALDEERQKTM